MKNAAIFDRLQRDGHRLTAARKAIIALLDASPSPIGAADILTSLKKKKTGVDRATVYRELEFLVAEGIAESVRFEGRAMLYELAGTHHHHAVCLECGRVQDIDADAELEAAERRIATRAGFKLLRHSFELFGLCKKCR